MAKGAGRFFAFFDQPFPLNSLPEFSKLASWYQEEQPDLRLPLLRQIEKDFQLEEGYLQPSEEPFAAWLEKELHRILTYWMEREPARISQLLYRVDLAESKLQRAMDSGEYESLSALTAYLVMEREMQKVFLRWYLKNQSQNG